ncbi:MAG: hypothetical protein KDE33_28325 [Bacteroidetes bacterium]|nr:hypothetical protein [Bacteroidota bacterium]
MSIETYIRPIKPLKNFDIVLDYVGNMKKREIMLLPNEMIYKIHLPNISIKQIEYSKEPGNNYSVRITSLACKEDWDLYKDTIKAILHLTQGQAYYENESRIDDIDTYYNDKYIRNAQLSEWDIMKKLVDHEKKPIGTYCPFGWFYIGKNTVAEMEAYSSDEMKQIERLWYYIRIAQYELPHPQYTPVYDLLEKEEDKKRTLTGYNLNEFSYISYADLFALNDGNDSYLIPYEKLKEQKPKSWALIDEVQYRARALSEYEWNEFLNRVKKNSII